MTSQASAVSPPENAVESASLFSQLARARRMTDALFAMISREALYSRPIAERHRLIFYLGHFEAFDWNLIARKTLDMPSFRPEFDKLFEFGIDPEPGMAPADTPADWPSVDEVQWYRAEARSKIDAVFADVPREIVHVAVEHRLMHAETFAYLMHRLPYEQKLLPGDYHSIRKNGRGAVSIAPEMIYIPAGVATLGQKEGEFGWDNEFEEHSIDVPAFRVAPHKVTNGEYLEFVKAGGSSSSFWVERNGEYFYHGMFEEVPLPLDWPVYVTQEQASAYAAWKGKRLLSEAEFHRAAYGTVTGEQRVYPWGSECPENVAGNFDFRRWDPDSVMSDEPRSAFGIAQLVGNGWEWTSTEFQPFRGWKSFSFYPAYSSNFFDGKHFVIKGGCARTDRSLLRRSFRNWFRPNYPYVYAGFRLAEDC